MQTHEKLKSAYLCNYLFTLYFSVRFIRHHQISENVWSKMNENVCLVKNGECIARSPLPCSPQMGVMFKRGLAFSSVKV